MFKKANPAEMLARAEELKARVQRDANKNKREKPDPMAEARQRLAANPSPLFGKGGSVKSGPQSSPKSSGPKARAVGPQPRAKGKF